MAADQVDRLVAQEVGQRVGVALQRGDPVGDPALGAAPGQGGERVRARVDDDDVVAELGQGHGEPARAAAEVQDAQRTTQLGLLALDEGAHGGPHRRGPQGCLDATASGPPLLFGHGGHLLCWVWGSVASLMG